MGYMPREQPAKPAMPCNRPHLLLGCPPVALLPASGTCWAHYLVPTTFVALCTADWSIEALTLGTVVTGHMSYPQVVRQLCGRGGSLLLQLSLVFRCAGG